ncbi:MAG: c-type cytochrome [Gemmataceae bacterium]|nr:c-type cytochrome [Gemmataceae bacterium]
MKRLILASVCVLAASSWVFVAEAPDAKTHQVQLNGHTFTLPIGFEIELVAGPPLVNRPISAAFDEQGRLYVTDSSGSNEKTSIQLEKKPHRVVRLVDSKGNGKLDKATEFADRMMFPEGAMWHAGSLYVAAPPSIWKLTDTRGDGVADQRSEWFQGKTLGGCANDLHGPYLGPDGWIYWCKGAWAKQTHERPGKAPFVTRASHIFRCRPDGSGIEPVMTGGMDNPVGIAFTPTGDRIFTTTFFQFPAGGKRDGLIHAIYGGVYGKDHDPIYEHPWTAPTLMPVLTHLGPAAPCAIIRYESDGFGKDYQDNLFTCLFNMHKVTRHVLKEDGAALKTEDSDFLVSSNLDFHPTDVIEDADGSLLVIDTGGWYKLCCPTSQLVKPDVLGAIYRVRKKDAPKVADPRGLKLDWAKLSNKDLVGLFDDPRPVVRRRAVETLAAKKDGVFEALREVAWNRYDVSAQVRLNAIRCACRLEHADYGEFVASFIESELDQLVSRAALHALSLKRHFSPRLLRVLEKGSPAKQRAAAEVLGRSGNKVAVPALREGIVPALLQAVAAIKEVPGSTSERVLEHSMIYALIELGDRKGTAEGLKSKDPRVRKAALIALDQMTDGKLEADAVAKELSSSDAAMKEAASWIVGRHPEWGTALAGLFRDKLAAKELPPAEQEELVKQLARLARNAAVQDLLANALRGDSVTGRRVSLRAMAQSGLKQVPDTWTASLIIVLGGTENDLLRDAVTTARALPWGKQRPEKVVAELLRVGGEAELPPDVRLTALAAVPISVGEVSPGLFDFLRARLGSDQPVAVRTLSAEVLSRTKLDNAQLLTLTETLKAVGPMEMDRMLQAFAQSTDEKVGLALVAALKASPARSALPVGTLRPRLAKFGPTVQKEAEQLYALLDADSAAQKAKLEKMLMALKDGDIRRGQAVFNGTKAACSSCHAIGYLGGNVGPDLTRIGGIRTERDLLESIVFPSASFVQGYEPVVLTTKDGKIHNGLLKKNAPDEVLLVLGANQEVRIARGDIDEIQPSKVSVMPAGLDQQLSPQDLADLIAFLKACK